MSELEKLVLIVALVVVAVVLIVIGSRWQQKDLNRWLASEAAALGGRFSDSPRKPEDESDATPYSQFGPQIENVGGEPGARVFQASVVGARSTMRFGVELLVTTWVPRIFCVIIGPVFLCKK